VAGKKILVLDENESSLKFLANLLRHKQFEVFEAPSGKEALIIAWRDDPALILFDPVLSDIKAEEFLQKLRHNPRTANTPIIALSSDPSPARKESCLNAGVTGYLIKSSETLHALDDLLKNVFGAEPSVKTTTEVVSNETHELGLLIVFLSAKGGTGTSSLCANLAMNIKMHQPEASVVVADLVLPIGSIAQIVGADEKLNLVTVADLPAVQTQGEYFHKNLPEPELWKFQLLAGSPDPQHGNNLKGDRIDQIVDVLRASYDFIILDIGRSLSRISLPLIQQADLITLIVSTDQSTIHLTKTVWEYLQTQGVEDKSIYAILNRAVGLEGLTKTEAEGIMGIPIKTMIPYMGSNFTLANNLNQPITIKYPKDTASIVLKEAAENMVKLARRQRVR
jgi:Flp pilus assembly CpaE family ATPase